jgi:hypothetical protein
MTLFKKQVPVLPGEPEEKPRVRLVTNVGDQIEIRTRKFPEKFYSFKTLPLQHTFSRNRSQTDEI